VLYETNFGKFAQNVKIHVDVFWVMTPCSIMVGYQCWRWRQHGRLQRWYPTTPLHGITTQKTSTWIHRCTFHNQSEYMQNRP